MFANVLRLLVLPSAVICILSACGLLAEYEYCEGKGECCGLIDNRDNRFTKYFCVNDPKDCIAENTNQIVQYPTYPIGSDCKRRPISSSSNISNSARLSSYPLSPNILDKVETFFADSIIQVSSNTGALDCRYVCETSSPLCSEFPATVGYRNQLTQFAKLFDTETAVIPKSSVMEVFKQEVDQCNRSDLFIEDGRFVNSSEAGTCIVSRTKNIGSEKRPELLHMQLFLPKEITGNIEAAKGRIAVYFDPGSEPMFVFDENPQSLYSGPMSSLEADSDLLIASIGGSCLFVRGGSI